MSKYILRLDDAAERMDVAKWRRIEELLDRYCIKPLVGIIPNCKDPMMDKYKKDDGFWDKVQLWIKKGWQIALHGYEHVYCTKEGGINPVNKRSEFAGLPLEEQRRKIRSGLKILKEHDIVPEVFFAPSHTFDLETLNALRQESNISIISDTIANKPYSQYGFTFVPQQSGAVRKLPINTITFCYHPNMMTDSDYSSLELFLIKNSNSFISFPTDKVSKRPGGLDKFLKALYFIRRKF